MESKEASVVHLLLSQTERTADLYAEENREEKGKPDDALGRGM